VIRKPDIGMKVKIGARKYIFQGKKKENRGQGLSKGTGLLIKGRWTSAGSRGGANYIF